MPTTQSVQPIQQPPIEDLRNALQIAFGYRQGSPLFGHQVMADIERIAKLLKSGLSKLGEPHPHTVELTRRYLEAACGRSVDEREARDFAMVVITSALKWEAP